MEYLIKPLTSIKEEYIHPLKKEYKTIELKERIIKYFNNGTIWIQMDFTVFPILLLVIKENIQTLDCMLKKIGQKLYTF